MTEPTKPRVFAVRPGIPFARAFARGFYHRFGTTDPRRTAQTRILLNTRRTLRAIEDALADAAPGSAILPQMSLIPELFADPMQMPDIPPAVSPMRRRLYLTKLVERQLNVIRGKGQTAISPGAAGDLADALGFLIDQFHDEGLDLRTIADALDPGQLNDKAAAHWLVSREFVDVVGQHWTDILADSEHGALDPRDRQRRVVNALIADWDEMPPDTPVIAAGSTGSVGSTADLMAAIARLPEGAVVLPGFDPDVAPDIWEAAGPDHPLGPFRGLLQRLEIQPADVELWSDDPAGPRQQLMTQAMRPAPVTDHWFEQAPALKEVASAALSDLTLLHAPSPRQEAEALAVAIREQIEDPTVTVAVITPDASLARRLTAALGKFGIVADDSLGRPLAQTPPGVLGRMVATFAVGRGSPVDLAALLGHPLVRPAMTRGAHLRNARAYELAVLRRIPGGRLTGLPDWPKATPEQSEWLTSITAMFAPFASLTTGDLTLGAAVAAHRALLDALCADPETGHAQVWDGPAGAELDRFLRELADAAPVYGETALDDYPTLLNGLMSSQQVRPDPATPHPRVAIWGPREARVLSADVLILAGLTDGVWPALPDPDPWLSRPMRSAIGLPAPERQIGLSAHDFMQAACQARVILSHAQRIEGSPVVPSRWLIRLENLVAGVGAEASLKEARSRGTRLLALAAQLAAPTKTVPRAPRPRATPPAAARPRQLSVTQLETLVRDAYAIYARHVLKLKPLDPLERQPDARDRGNVVHKVLEAFTERCPNWPGVEPAQTLLMEIADEILGGEVSAPDLRRVWRARIERFGAWFLEAEEIRRQTVARIVTEQRAKYPVNLAGGPFTLSATADRIDIATDGTAAIYDYKGSPPSRKKINIGFNQQLHVQGAMVEAGGVDGLASHTVRTGSFIALTGSGSGGTEVSIDNLSDEIPEHMQRVTALLEKYDAGHPYIALNAPEREAWEGDYDHLARREEWDGEDTP